MDLELQTRLIVDAELRKQGYPHFFGEVRTYQDGRQLSEIVSELVSIGANEDIGFEDVSAWGAPSECARDVADWAKGEREDLFTRGGFSFYDSRERFHPGALDLDEQIVSRTSAKWAYFGIPAAEGRVHLRRCPFCQDRLEGGKR